MGQMLRGYCRSENPGREPPHHITEVHEYTGRSVEEDKATKCKVLKYKLHLLNISNKPPNYRDRNSFFEIT